MKSSYFRALQPLILALLFGTLFFNSSQNLLRRNQAWVDEVPVVVLPEPLQLVIAGGDRYLAANLGAFRAVMLTTSRLDKEGADALGRIQRVCARLNPLGEDNYYTAQAILPWVSQVDAALAVMSAATLHRTWDELPPFFWAFDLFYFKNDYLAASTVLDVHAIPIANEGNKVALLALKAKWMEQGNSPQRALELLNAMIQGTEERRLKKLLIARRDRVAGLLVLRDAADAYMRQRGQAPAELNDLIEAGLLKQMPVDPFGIGYTMEAGVPALRRR